MIWIILECSIYLYFLVQIELCRHIVLNSCSCRGYLHKMGARIKSWSKRWFVFDRNKRTLVYYADKSEVRRTMLTRDTFRHLQSSSSFHDVTLNYWCQFSFIRHNFI